MDRSRLYRGLAIWVLAAGLATTFPGLPAGAEPLRLPLWKNTATESPSTLTVHLAERPTGIGVVICPGGGYGGLVTGAEGHGIANWLNDHGITGLVLEYELPRGRPNVPLRDAQRAIRVARARADEWHLNADRIGMMGFSAGGHLAATAGNHFDPGDPQAQDPIERHSSRPDFLLLIYPVISMGELAHAGSRRNLLGENPDPELAQRFSSELQVTPRTPPTFLAHAADDTVVPPAHSQMFHEALQQQQVPTRYLELPRGGHGLNGYQGPMWEAWQRAALQWIHTLPTVR